MNHPIAFTLFKVPGMETGFPFSSFTISPVTSENKKVIDNILGGFAAGNQEQIVSFINEYDYPSSASTGGHYHIRIGGKIESSRIAGFIKLAKENKLTTYTIA